MATSSAEPEADDALPLSNVSQAVFERHVKTLLRNYGPTDPDQVKGKKLLYAKELGKQPWVTDDVFIRAVNLTVIDSGIEFFPPFGKFLDACHRANGELGQEARRELERLPAPEPSPAGEVQMARYRAMVKASTARGTALMARRDELILDGQRRGLRQGTDALSEWVTERYLAELVRWPGEGGAGTDAPAAGTRPADATPLWPGAGERG